MAMNPADVQGIMAVFLEEMGELLQEVEKDVLSLADTPENTTLVDRLFRNLHTIKGGAGMAEMEILASYTHAVETMLDEVRKGKIALSPTLIAILLESVDCLKNFMEETLGREPFNHVRLKQSRIKINEVMTGGNKSPEPPLPPEQPAAPPSPLVSLSTSTYILQIRVKPHLFPDPAELAGVIETLKQLGTTLVISHEHSLPPEEKRSKEEFYLWRSIHLVTASTTENITKALGEWPTQHLVALIPVDILPESPENQAQVDAAVDGQAPEVTKAKPPKQHPLPKTATPSPPPPAQTKPTLPAKNRSAGKTDVQSVLKVGSIRVDTGKLDKLVNLVGELITVAARLDSFQSFMEERDTDLAEGLLEILDDSSRIVRELQDQAITIRMVPIGNAFEPMKRLVHDYCNSSGKKARIAIAGYETEVDKKVAEQLSGPLKHLIRNSLDHGIEPPAEREAQGKPPEGQITLSANYQYGLIVINIADDGRGIDVKRVIQSAKEKGIIDANHELSEREGLELIFAPSVSTAQEVTEISGRGVGMDVVKRDIETLRGTVDIGSIPGQGTTITINIPMTLSIVDGLLVCVGDNRYIIPLSMVEECVERVVVSKSDDSSNFLEIRGDLVPFLQLRDLFDVPGETEAFEKIVIVSSGKHRVGLVVDHLLGNHQTVIKSLSPLHRDVHCFVGATILGDGNVVLILDVLHLIELGKNREDRRRTHERRRTP